MNNWQKVRLGDVCKIIPGYAFKSRDWTDVGVPVVKIKNIQSDCTVSLEDVDFVPMEIITAKIDKFRLEDKDILVAMTGATAGKVGRLRTQSPAYLNQRVAKIKPFGADTGFIWAVVSSQQYQERFFHLADGAAQPNMSGGQIEGVELMLPTLDEQRRIAAILSAYDDLIENNTRRIAILEEMARRIYEEWFFRFRFPGHERVKMVESELGLIPEGWQNIKLGHLIDIDKGLSYNGKGLTEDGLPMINLKNIVPGGGFRRDGTKPYSGDFKQRHTVKTGDIVLANTDLTQAGLVVGSPAIVPTLETKPALFTHHLYAVRKKDVSFPNTYLYYLLAHPSFKAFAKGYASGTTVLGLPREGVLDYEFALPLPDLIAGFDAKTGDIQRLAEVLHRKNANLRATRDLLLPKLISGELDVSTLPEPEAVAA